MELIVHAQSKDVETTIIVYARIPRRIRNDAAPSVVHVRVRSDRLGRERIGPIVLQGVPYIEILIPRIRGLCTVVLAGSDRILRQQYVERITRGVVHLVVGACERVVVVGFTEVVLAQVRQIADIATPSRDDQMSTP